jgi:hypothetical protein
MKAYDKFKNEQGQLAEIRVKHLAPHCYSYYLVVELADGQKRRETFHDLERLERRIQIGGWTKI